MGGGPPNIPKGTPFLAAGAFLLLGGGYVLSNSLFNVDGGHRAIKYTRVSGVSKEIYSEGKQREPTGSSGSPQRTFQKAPTLTGLGT
jgi:prohibitin 2